jgi:hypothetical protein
VARLVNSDAVVARGLDVLAVVLERAEVDASRRSPAMMTPRGELTMFEMSAFTFGLLLVLLEGGRTIPDGVVLVARKQDVVRRGNEIVEVRGAQLAFLEPAHVERIPNDELGLAPRVARQEKVEVSLRVCGVALLPFVEGRSENKLAES